MKPKSKLRCAIYTRKSSEEGLDQQFNSLDAQREACEAYIQSQKHEGWGALKDQFDDGGFSGGNMQRPALTKLVDAIKQKLVDIIVVYKVDRLSRSLGDFAKLVELFDEHNVSFVSVTQQFNTSTSMGRLTLNVLLSFAQFEREVTGERIRDKIAASKKKGLWMGGYVPLGYKTKDRKLVMDRNDAKTVRYIFKQYNQLKSVRLLKHHLDENNIKSKQGKFFSAGMLYKLLQNPHYIGKIRHKLKTYEGEHSSIIDIKIWKQTQAILKLNRNNHITKRHAQHKSHLAGKLFDDKGNRMSPSHANKGSKRHRYYVSQALLDYREQEAGSISRINARDIETAVINTLNKFLSVPNKVLKQLGYKKPDLNIINKIHNAHTSDENNYKDTELFECIDIVKISSKLLSIEVTSSKVAKLFNTEARRHDAIQLKENIDWHINSKGSSLFIDGKTIAANTRSNEALKKSLIRALEWNQGLLDGSIDSLCKIEKKEGLNSSYVRRTLRLAYLNPKQIKSILNEKHDPSVILEKLRDKGILTGVMYKVSTFGA